MCWASASEHCSLPAAVSCPSAAPALSPAAARHRHKPQHCRRLYQREHLTLEGLYRGKDSLDSSSLGGGPFGTQQESIHQHLNADNDSQPAQAKGHRTPSRSQPMQGRSENLPQGPGWNVHPKLSGALNSSALGVRWNWLPPRVSVASGPRIPLLRSGVEEPMPQLRFLGWFFL